MPIHTHANFNLLKFDLIITPWVVSYLKWGLINHCSSSQISNVCSDIFVLTSNVFSNGWLSHFVRFNGSEWYLAIVFYRVSKNINFSITAFQWYFCQDCIFVTHTDNQFHIVQYKYNLYWTFAWVPSWGGDYKEFDICFNRNTFVLAAWLNRMICGIFNNMVMFSASTNHDMIIRHVVLDDIYSYMSFKE